jgi:hypothetical protein
MIERPQPQIGGWTITTVLTYLSDIIGSNDRRYDQRFNDMHAINNQRFEAQEKAVMAAMQAASTAVSKAEVAAEKRLDAVNEFRGTLADQQRNLMPRSEVLVTIQAMADRMTTLEKQLDTLQGERRGISGGWGYAVGVVGFVLTLLSLGLLAFRVLHLP